MYNQTAALYGRTARTGFKPRLLEAELLSQCAGDLARAATTLPETEALIEALERNRMVWSRLALLLRHGDTDLNDDQRRSMLRLAALVFLRTAEACDKPGRVAVEVLVNINLSLAAGLRGEAPTRR